MFFDENFDDLAEYECMLKLLSNAGWVKDLCRVQLKESPITYGDVKIDDEKLEIPLETTLTDKIDLMSQ